MRVLALQVHAENGEAVALGQQLVFDAGITGPEGHALSRPAVLEGEATARAIRLAAFVGAPLYVVHVMSKDAADEVRRRVRACLLQLPAVVLAAWQCSLSMRLHAFGARKLCMQPLQHPRAACCCFVLLVLLVPPHTCCWACLDPGRRRRCRCPRAAQVARARAAGQRVIGEPVASGLALDETAMWDANFTRAAAAVMSPPIRGAVHRDALKRALAGGLLQLVATDHAVFNSSQKEVGRRDFRAIPNGVNGLEERLHVVWQELVVPGEQ